MPHTYLQDIKKIIDALSADERLILEEKLIVLGMMNNRITRVTTTIEDELATCKDGLIQ